MSATGSSDNWIRAIIKQEIAAINVDIVSGVSEAVGSKHNALVGRVNELTARMEQGFLLVHKTLAAMSEELDANVEWVQAIENRLEKLERQNRIASDIFDSVNALNRSTIGRLDRLEEASGPAGDHRTYGGTRAYTPSYAPPPRYSPDGGTPLNPIDDDDPFDCGRDDDYDEPYDFESSDPWLYGPR